VLWWLRISCGIRHVVRGLEHVPRQPCVVLAKHASTWETLFLQTLFAPQATAIKRELLDIPFFGWAFRLLKPIAIDRRQPVSAIRQLIDTGSRRLAAGIWVVLLPEGTRVPGNQVGRFFRGGAALAVAAQRPILVIAHDAARCWPPHALAKFPGTIHVTISPPIDLAGRDADAMNEAARTWLLGAMAELGRGSA
jgi:1-acyl-sn-glycerol-3-phosphate acyltransferase